VEAEARSQGLSEEEVRKRMETCRGQHAQQLEQQKAATRAEEGESLAPPLRFSRRPDGGDGARGDSPISRDSLMRPSPRLATLPGTPGRRGPINGPTVGMWVPPLSEQEILRLTPSQCQEELRRT